MTDRILPLALAFMLSSFATSAKSADESFCDSAFTLEAIYKVQLPSYHRDAPGEMVKISDQTPYIEIIPPVFEHAIETVVTQEGKSELVVIPAVWDWVEGEFPGTSEHTILTVPEFETIRETVVVEAEISHNYFKQPAKYQLHKGEKYLVKGPVFVNVVIPAVTKEVDQRVVKTPAKLKSVLRKI